MEIKSTYTIKQDQEMNQAKWARVKQLGFIMEIQVYNSKGKNVSTQIF